MEKSNTAKLGVFIKSLLSRGSVLCYKWADDQKGSLTLGCLLAHLCKKSRNDFLDKWASEQLSVSEPFCLSTHL